jgi:hypothetical protein
MQTDPDYLQDLLSRLSSHDEETRGKAVREARALPPEAQLRLLDHAASPGRTPLGRPLPFPFARFIRFRLLPTRNNTFFGMLVVTLAQEATDHRLLWPVLTALWQFECLLGNYDEGKAPDRPLSSRQVRSQVGQLYRRIWLKPRMELMRAMSRLLPHISIAEANTFTLEQRKALLIPLQAPYRDVELTLCLLGLLAHSGGEEALPVVEQLASRGIETENGRRILQAARECLPCLRDRLERNRQAHSLLRPASPEAAGSPSAELLRPVSSDNENPCKVVQ